MSRWQISGQERRSEIDAKIAKRRRRVVSVWRVSAVSCDSTSRRGAPRAGLYLTYRIPPSAL